MNIEKMLTAEMPDSMVGKVVTSFDTQVSDPDVNVASYGLTKQLNDNLTASNQTAGVTNVPFRFGCTDDGKFGYIINQGGADSVIPFNSEYKYMIVGLSGISFAFCIDTENGIAAVKTDSDADTINNEYLKIKSSGYNVTVTANKNIVIHYIGGYTDNSNANFEDFTEKSMSTNETLTISQTSGHDKFYILVEK